MMTKIEGISEGDCLSTLEKDISRPQVFRYSAITWNAHRIHYDPEHARNEDHPDVLVQQHFHGAVIQELIMDWLEGEGFIEYLQWRNIGRATPNEQLYVEAEVASIDESIGRVEFDVCTHTNIERCSEGVVRTIFNS